MGVVERRETQDPAEFSHLGTQRIGNLWLLAGGVEDLAMPGSIVVHRDVEGGTYRIGGALHHCPRVAAVPPNRKTVVLRPGHQGIRFAGVVQSGGQLHGVVVRRPQIVRGRQQ